MSDPVLHSNHPPSTSSLSSLRIVLIVACIATGIWLGIRSETGSVAGSVQQTIPAVQRQGVEATPELQPAFAEESTNAPATESVLQVATAPAAPLAAQLQARVDTALALAQSSPEEALRWSKALPAAERAPAIVAAANEVARTKPAEALAALVELEPSASRDAALAHAASQWASVDPKAAAGWAAEGTPGALREQICSAVAISMANQDPRVAAEFLAAQMENGVSLRIAAVAVIQRWAQKDGRAARQWAEQFPPGALRDDALHEIDTQARAGIGSR